ncbi:hypothetical protein JCM16303_006829 [Sporobolomyces ruberrimus]
MSSNQATSSQTSLNQQDKSKQPRLGRACDTCRRRKVRCEGGAPAGDGGDQDQPCTLCVNQGIPCTYEHRTTKRGPPKGYVESLERRLEAMESLLSQFAGKEGRSLPLDSSTTTPDNQEHGSSRGQSFDSADDGAIFPTSISASPGSPISSAVPRATGLDAIDELGMKLDDLAVETNRYVGRSSGMHLMRSMQQYAEPFAPSILNEATPSTIETLLREEHNLRHRSDVALPPGPLAKRLLDAAFNDFQIRWTIPRAFFDDCVNKGMLDSDPSFKGLYLALLAVGSRAVPNTMDRARTPNETRIVEGWTWFKAALSASGSPLDSASLFSLLRIAVLSAWQLGSMGFVTTWSLVGWGVRQAVDVGAHCEDRADWNASPLRNQLRKRAFFTLVALDYYGSSTLGRPFAIQEDDWDVTPPLSISDSDLLEWDRQTNIARLNGQPLPKQPPQSSESVTPGPGVIPVHSGGYPWASTMSLYSIMAKTMKNLYGLRRDKTLKGTKDTVRDLDSKLNAWLEKVPAHIRWNPGQQDDEALLLSAAVYSSYYCSQIMVHREFISPSRSSALSFPSLAICSNAARSCAHVLDTLRQRGILYRAYAYAPVTAVQNASILLLGRFASPDANAQLTPSAAADVKRCINVLHDLAPTTYLALKCYEGMVKLASLVTAPPSARSTNPLSASVSSGNKRSIPSEWADGQSPAASQSDRPSPSSNSEPYGAPGGAGESLEGSAHKQRRLQQSASGMPLPLSTFDLSAETFKGRATFATGSAGGNSDNVQVTSSSSNRSSWNGQAYSGSGGPAAPDLSISNAYPDLFPPTSSTPSHYSTSGLDVNNGFQANLPQAVPFSGSVPTSLPEVPLDLTAFDPNLSTPLASSYLDLGSDFFSFGSTGGDENHIPADVGRAAADLWHTFSTMTPMNLEEAAKFDATNTSTGTDRSRGATGRPDWNTASTSGDFVVNGGNGSAGEGGTQRTNGFDPFSQWDFSDPGRNDPAANNQWNLYGAQKRDLTRPFPFDSS